MLPPSFLSSASPSFHLVLKVFQEGQHHVVQFLQSLSGWEGRGWKWWRKMSSFFFSLRSKEFKRCPSLSVSLRGGKGQKFGQGPGPCRLRQVSLAVGSHRSLLGASVVALLEVIFDLPSFPFRKPDSFVSIKSKKVKKQVI